ncbi:MAG: ABC transporter permease [Sphaerochaetaceae bacterium]|nr:ABC transporter permease [Sphaerochaetaceae bacterium]
MFFENVKLALKAMKGNKMRTILSLLGIIIGVASVITILNLGNSATGSITSSISSSGYNILYLSPGSGSRNTDTFNELFGQTLTENFEEIDTVMPTVSSSTRIRQGNEITSCQIMGVETDYGNNMDCELEYGSWFDYTDNIFKRQVVVLGSEIAESLFPACDAVGNYVSIFRNQSKRYLVVGVLAEKDSTLSTSYNTSIFIPYNTFAQRFQNVSSVGTYVITVAEGYDPVKVTDKLTEYLDNLVGSDNYSLMSSASLAEMASSITGTLSSFLAAIGGISLLVGGIGIMNIMLVSVAERTKEIGIRKALGAPPRIIKGQFLTEAITLTLTGGILGIGLGIGISRIVTGMAGWTFSVSLSACILSVAFSMAIGVFFGLYPAAKAAKMDPIESLNYE